MEYGGEFIEISARQDKIACRTLDELHSARVNVTQSLIKTKIFVTILQLHLVRAFSLSIHDCSITGVGGS